MDKEKVAVFDLEGTITDCSHRLHHYKKGEYDIWNGKLYLDPVNKDGLKYLIDHYSLGHKIIVVTAKNESYAKEVDEWIKKMKLHTTIDKIIYRERLDSRPSVNVKSDILKGLMKKYEIVASYDDRPENIQLMKGMGLNSILIKTPAANSPAEGLKEAIRLFESRNKEYGEAYKGFGSRVKPFFPNGLTLKTEEDFTRFGALIMMIGKLERYTQNFSKGGHTDSLMDLSVYSQMLNSIDKDK